MSKSPLYQSKQDYLDDLLELNPELELPYDTPQLNYDYLRRTQRFDNNGLPIDYDSLVYEPSEWEMF